MEPLHIHLFGGFLLERGGTALPPIASRAGRSLFAYLAMHPGRPLQRDYLAGMFWPDLPEGRARRRLSHTLWQIQDVVNTESASYLDATTDTLAFNESTPYWLDVAVFDQGFSARPEEGSHRGHEATRLRSCVELYRGDFLAGYFDDWVLVEQDHYRQRYLVALRRLIDATKSNGAYEEALAYARRLTHHDPLSEEAHREVMRLDFLLGRTTDAIEQFERCRSVLEEELGTEPSAPTIEIYEKIMKQRRSGVRPLREDERAVLLGRRADTPFVGRDQERRRLIDSFERVLSGAGGVVLVEGEPGVGKTRTTLEAAEDARWRGFEVSWGSCRPGALRPFAPLIEVLESLSPLRVEQLSEQVSSVWLGEVARLVPSIALRVDAEGSAQLRPAEESTRMIESLVNVMGALGKIAPHLIIIDDVHWADQDTLAVLTQVGQRLAESRVLLMLLYRSEEARGDAAVWDVMRDLDRAAGLSRVVLSPLSVFELEEMVRRVLGTTQLDAEVASRLHRQTGGNVLFTLETLLAMRDRGLFESGADPATVLEQQIQGGGVPLAPRVRSVIESRLSMLSDEVTTVYKLAAVADDRVGLPLIEAATGFSRSSVLAAVDELLYRGLVIDDGLGQYRLTHDQVRQVVYDEMNPEVRSRLHLRVAETLADSDPDKVEAIGHHFHASGNPARATDYLERAGLRAVELNAFGTARSHLQTAYETASEAGVGDVRRYQLLGHLDEVLGVLGRRAEQREVIGEMSLIAEALPALHGDLERRRAWLLAQTGELHEAEASARHSVAVERSDGDDEGVASSLVALGTIQRWSGRPLEAIPALTEAVELANDPSDRADALTELASTLVEVQQIDQALEHLAEAGEIYRSLNDLRGQAEVAGIEARLHTRHRRAEPSTGELSDRDRPLQTDRIPTRRGCQSHQPGESAAAGGSVADALSGYDNAVRIFAELGNRRGEAMVLVNSASARHTLLGEDERARSDAIAAHALFAAIGDQARQAQCDIILAGIEARAGRGKAAEEMLQACVNCLNETGSAVLEGQALRSLALVQIENRDKDALSTLDRADRLVETAGLKDLAVELRSIRALALLFNGDTDRALALSGEAAEQTSPEVEHSYLVHHRHALCAEAVGDLKAAWRSGMKAETLLRNALVGLSGDELHHAVDLVPEHRAIVSQAQRIGPRVLKVKLPASEAPTGRPLKSNDLRHVNWTVEHPDDLQHATDIERRRARLLRLLNEAEAEGASPTTEHLATALSVSSSTIRRDLDSLRASGHSLHTRGQRRTG
jgi:DNA-binding SARP family transcriptional activator/biotin operon repressor